MPHTSPQITLQVQHDVNSSEAATDFQRVLNLATSIIGNSEQALRWMGTPVRALDYLTPVSLMGSQGGAEAVEAVLHRLEHGISA